MTQMLSSESDNLAACYLFILERMRARRQRQAETPLANSTGDQSGDGASGVVSVTNDDNDPT
jgi:hypothetical protein